METGTNQKAWVILAALALLLSGMGQSDSSATSMMYWTDLGTKKIQRANLDGSGVTNLITTGLGTLHYLALDTAGGKMYWTDSAFDSIQRANLNGSHIEALVTTGLSSPGGIALDVEAGKMYWTDSITHKIQRANLNGNGVEDLVTTGLQWPQGIALDVTGGKMYWTDGGTDKIQRANLDGSGVEDLFNAGSSALQGIALDVSAGKMYWADLVKIQRANLDGSDVEFLVTTGGRLRGIALDVLAGKMYWTDTLWYGKIQCANLDGSGVKDLIVGGMNFPLGLALDVPKPPKIIYVDVDANGLNNGSSWADAFYYIQDALAVALTGDEIRVAQGIYKPAPPPSPQPPPGPPLPPPPSPPTTGLDDKQVAGTMPGDRTAAFQLKNGVTIKGGYAGAGAQDPNVRDIQLYETILSGDLSGNDKEVKNPYDLLDDPCRAENSYHVVTANVKDASTLMDGFTITGGNANGSYSYYHGGGMLSSHYKSPTVANCIFLGNSASRYGGGVDGSPAITSCTFTRNYAHEKGGGMYIMDPNILNCNFIENSAGDGGAIFCAGPPPPSMPPGLPLPAPWLGPTITNCTLTGNSAIAGGGLYNRYTAPKLTNCIFSGNSASVAGGGMLIYYKTQGQLINCTFAGNSALNGNAMACKPSSQRHSSDLQVSNCILWDGGNEIWNDGNSTFTFTYSNIQGSCPGESNIDADPLFVEPGYWDANGVWIDGDYHLLVDSPCIDAGDPNYIAEPNETDLDGRPRILDGRIDMGAYEFFNTLPVADAGPDQVVECACNTVEGTKVTLDGTGSYDVDGDALTYIWSGLFVESPADGATPTVTLEAGCPDDYVITLVVNDGTEDSEPNEVKITVVDTTPPEFTLAVSPTMLWPPNKKMVKITPSWTLSDNCDATPDVSLVSVSMNESETRSKGHTDDDIQIGDDGEIYVRSERSGTGSDRVYTITYQAVDDSGNTTVRSATVSIPHDFKVLARIASRWLWSNPSGRIPEDLNGDGIVNLMDFAKFAENWIK